jgi:hypothetical protein
VGKLRSRVAAKLRDVGVINPPAFQASQQQLRDQNDQIAARLAVLEQALAGQSGDILDEYCGDPPSAQTALDVFAGEWASSFPEPLSHLQAGSAPLFAIEHIPWGVDVLGGVKGQRVVELGPLEGGHTFILDRMGAAEVVAVEANTRAFLKCLISKELLGIPSAKFLCGDAIKYLEQELAHGRPTFDMCVASGVLYHLKNPVAALDLMTRSSDRLLLWTMYYDHDYIQSREDLKGKFPGATQMEYAGYRHTLYRQEYQQALDFKGFCGGSAASSAWMTRGDIIGAIEHFGFEIVDIGFEERNHKNNGPCICIAARRKA